PCANQTVEPGEGQRHACGPEELATTQFHWETLSTYVSSSTVSPPTLLIQEQLALDDLVNERAQTVVLIARLADDGFDCRLIGSLRRGTRGVRQQLFGQGAGELVLVAEKQLLELIDVTETPAIRQYVAELYLRPIEIGHLAAIHDYRLAAGGGPIILP